MTNAELERIIREQVTKALASNTSEFSNVARPKATKASTATQGAWTTKEAPKASSATEGAWDATNTPGGVSSNAKKVWTRDALKDEIKKVVTVSAAFANKPVEPSGKISFSNDVVSPSGKTSFSNTVVAPSGRTSFSNTAVAPSGKTSFSNTSVAPSGKVSASSRAAWDNTGNPGAVSEEAKKVWTKEAIAAEVRKVISENPAFFNKPFEPSGNTSSSTQASWNDDYSHESISASTQPGWNTEEKKEPQINASVLAQVISNVFKAMQ